MANICFKTLLIVSTAVGLGLAVPALTAPSANMSLTRISAPTHDTLTAQASTGSSAMRIER